MKIMKCSRALTLVIAVSLTVSARAADESPVKLNSLGGFILFDYLNFFPDKKHVEMTPGSAGRAMRLDVQGTIREKWSFRGQYDFVGDAARVRHAWLQYNFAENNGIRIGQQVFNYGLESSASIKDMLTMERAMFHRAWGIRFLKAVTWNYRNDGFFSSLGLFGEDESRNGNPNNTFAYNWRGAWIPVHNDGALIHFGAVANRTSFRNGSEARFRVNPSGAQSSGGSQLYLVDTGAIANRDFMMKGGLELVLAYRNFALFGEYNQAQVARTSTADLHFNGYYADLLWIITQENFPYNAKIATFEGVKPASADGAWGLSVRFDRLDLNDDDIAGGEETDLSLALIWWANSNVKMMGQFTKTQANKNGVEDNPSLLQVRAQVPF
jgi:phosphate-selective porin OprO/OprP